MGDLANEATAQAPEKRPRPKPAASPPPDDLEVLGETRLRPNQVAEPAELVVVAGSFKGTTVRLGAGTVVIGRASECDLVLRTGSGVSRRHCKVQYLGNRFVVVDLESRNGTIVNGQSVERKVLEPGDRIEVGDEVIEFVVRAAPTAAPRAPAPSRDVTAPYVPASTAAPAVPPPDDDDDGGELPPTLPPQSAAPDLPRARGTAGALEAPRSPRDTGAFSAVPDVPSLPPRASSQKFGRPGVVSPAPPLPPTTPRRVTPWLFFGVVVVASLGALGFLAWDAFDEAPAAVVDAGAAVPVAAVVDAGAAVPVAAVVDAGAAAPVAVVVDAGAIAPVAVVVDAGQAAAAVEAGAVAAPSLVAVRAHGAGRAREVLVAPGDRVDVGTALVVVEVEGGGGRKLAALRREEAEFAAANDPRARAELAAVRAEIRRLESHSTGSLTMVSDRAGTIVDVLVKVGDVVRDATPVVRLRP